MPMTTLAVPEWHEPDLQAAAPPPRPRPVVAPGEIPAGVGRGDELGSQVSETVAPGWPELDAQLPGAGWPCRSITELLAPQPAVLEWRLLGGAIRQVVAGGGQVVLV